MANGKELINELNYRQLIEQMPPKELSRFTALQTYENNITLQKHASRLDVIETRLPVHPTKKKQVAFGGTIVTAAVAAFYTVGRQFGWWN